MKINILTLFPEMFKPLEVSIIGKSVENNILELNYINFREYSDNKHHKVDDYPFGGGQGMVLKCQPIFSALSEVTTPQKKNIYMSPKGKILTKDIAKELSKQDEITILCGHYEGVDQRVIDYWNMEEISIGDYILTGGELPAMVLVDTVARMLPKVLSGEDSAFDESIYSGLLEYPHYTKPREFCEKTVPEVLVSGNHKKIDLWRFEESLKLTKKNRPDLFEDFLKREKELIKEEHILLEKYSK